MINSHTGAPLRRIALVALMASIGFGLCGCSAFSSKRDSGMPPQQQIKQNLPSRSQLPLSEQKIDQAEVARINTELSANYYTFKQYDAAMEAVIRAIEAQPENPKGLLMAAFIQMELKDMPKAQYFMDRAVALAPGDPEIVHNQATFLCRSGREAEAIRIFDRAISMPTYRRPGLSQAAAGVCLVKLKRLDEAFDRFTEALESEPMHPQALLGLAEIYLHRGDAMKARSFLQRQQRVAPVSPESLWVEVQATRALGLKADEAMANADLRSQYPDSEQAKKLATGN